ncbi:MAG: hypothetical protein EON58_20490, partial [Alphaproteobacteria bacterium]
MDFNLLYCDRVEDVLGLVGLMAMGAMQGATVMPFFGGRKAAFSLEFDDSMDSQVKNALPLLAKYNFQATFYL